MKKEDLDALVGLYESVYLQESGEYLVEAPQKTPSSTDIGYRVGRGLMGALRDLPAATISQLQGQGANRGNDAALNRQQVRGQRLMDLLRTGQANKPTSKPATPANPKVGNIPPEEGTGRGGPSDISRTSGGGRGAGRVRPSFQSTGGAGRYAPPSMQQRTSTGTSSGGTSSGGTSSGGSSSGGGNTGASAVRPASGTTSGIVGGKTSPAAASPQKSTGSAMDQWARANPNLAKAAAERKRIRGTSQTDNPLMKDMRSKMSLTPSVQSSNVSNLGKGNQSLVNNPNAAKAATTRPSAPPPPTTRPSAPPPPTSGPKNNKVLSQSYEWPSNKIVRDISSLYSSIYEAKKVDQNQDGDNNFEDVQIARMIASGMSKEEAIAAVRNKSYNEEVEIEEATRMRKELGKEGEIATRKELAARSRAFKRSDSVDKTIAAAERKADWSRDEKKAKTLRGLASSRRASVRDNPRVGLRGYANKVEGSDKDLQTSRQRAMSAGTLTPREKEKLGEDFEIWIDTLLQEGYDLSDYTWDEMFEIYEETEEEKKRNERRARIAELTAQGRVMTSSKRASQKARQRRETQNAERLEKLANAAISATTGASRRSSQAMGSQPPEPKQQAPAANRKLKSTVKNDKLASRADELLRMLQNEDFKLWISELLHEGYTLENWTDKELYDLYEEILEEKYGTTAGRKRV